MHIHIRYTRMIVLCVHTTLFYVNIFVIIGFWENIFMRIYLWEYVFEGIYWREYICENMFVRIFLVHWNFCANLNDVVLTSSTKSICFCADMRSGLLLILKDNHSFKNLCTCGWGLDILLLLTGKQMNASTSAWNNLLEESVMNLENIQSCEKLPNAVKMGKDATLVYSWLKKLGQPAS